MINLNMTKKRIREKSLCEKLKGDPFYTDEQLAEFFNVSIQTIRLDRMRNGIPELRERTKAMAQKAQNKLKAISNEDIVGELVDLVLGESAISTMQITPDMVLEKTGIARGHFMFAQANTLALALIDAPAALTGVGNVKYKLPVKSGAKLIAKAEVRKKRKNKFFVWVKIKHNDAEVFRAKFIVVSFEPNEVL